MSQEKDRIFFRNFSLVVGALAVMMVIFFITARIVGIRHTGEMEQRESAATAKRTAPMGETTVAGEDATQAALPADAVPAAAGSGDAGKKIYDGLCVSCHGSGIPGIPQMGDKAAWEPRIAQGMDTLYTHAINGFTMMMPPKGGGTYTDDEVKAAVDYMVAAVQGGMAAAPSAASAASTDAAVAEAAGVDGKKIYDGLCMACHGTGLPGVPQMGDKAAWEPRIAQGIDTLYAHAINGFTGTGGMMPPRGGGTYTDDEVKAAVDYIVSNSK
jgi:cytochrome c5